MSIIQMFVPDVPNPITNFPKFVCCLYSAKSLFAPKRPEDCLKLFEKLQVQNAVKFFFYEYPIYFQDPILYLETLLFLHDKNHKIWTEFISNSAVIDRFFEVHGGSLLPLEAGAPPVSWKHRLLVSELMFVMIQDSSKPLNSLVLKHIDYMIQLVAEAPLEFAGSILRYIIKLFKTQTKMQKDQLQTRSVQLLSSLHAAQSPLFRIAMRFLFTISPSVIAPARIVRMISQTGIRSISDIEIISEVTDSSCVLQAVFLLCKAALSGKQWHRACMSEVKSLLVKFPGRADVKEWFELYIRRLFIFIAIAHARNRYATRALLLCESLSVMAQVRLLWLQQSIFSAASSIFATKSHPPYMKLFFQCTAPVNDVIIHEYESFSSNDIPLKHFPFDPVKGSLMLPPLIDMRSQTVSGMRVYSRNSINSGRSTSSLSDRQDIRATALPKKQWIQRKRKPLITKPAKTRLASALCIAPTQRL